MLLYLAPFIGLISVLLSFYLYSYVIKQDRGTERMKYIADAIKEGAEAYLKRQNKTLAFFVMVMAIVLF
ncbi:MAG: sodium/proton-translocating pyrophosphatase, partial [Candidatus Methanomethylicia archaeon]